MVFLFLGSSGVLSIILFKNSSIVIFPLFDWSLILFLVVFLTVIDVVGSVFFDLALNCLQQFLIFLARSGCRSVSSSSLASAVFPPSGTPLLSSCAVSHSL